MVNGKLRLVGTIGNINAGIDHCIRSCAAKPTVSQYHYYSPFTIHNFYRALDYISRLTSYVSLNFRSIS